MENFFDVATPEEIRELWDEEFSFEDIEQERQSFESDPDTNYAYLFQLYFFIRNKKDKAMEYLEKIEDSQYKLEIYQLYVEPDVIVD